MIRRLLRNRSAVVGMALLSIPMLAAALTPVLTTANPYTTNMTRQLTPPGRQHPFGTDQFGRDVYSRVLWGSRTSLAVAAASLLLALTSGTLMGAAAGYFGGMVDDSLNRVIDLLMAFPMMMLAIIAVGVLGAGLLNVIVALGVSMLPRFARVVRGEVLAIKARHFVEAARAVGAGEGRILWRHILPNSFNPLIVMATVYMPYTILVESSLSFLGIGVSPDVPTWGLIIADGRGFIQLAPWISTFPGIAITVTSMGFNLFGDGLRDALDPRLKI
ncbi:MAG: ABC transporter permease [Armatimonadetes bacterium]|nr:ABC transporter permease [Armatimonadota bacterium]